MGAGNSTPADSSASANGITFVRPSKTKWQEKVPGLRNTNTYDANGMCKDCNGNGSMGERGYRTLWCTECMFTSRLSNIHEVFKYATTSDKYPSDYLDRWAIQCMEWCKNQWSPYDPNFGDPYFTKRLLVKAILNCSGKDKSEVFKKTLVATRIHILGELGKLPTEHPYLDTFHECCYDSNEGYAIRFPDKTPVIEGGDCTRCGRAFKSGNTYFKTLLAASEGWDAEDKAALQKMFEKKPYLFKRRRLISTGAPPVDTSLPNVTAGSALVPPPQESGIWMLALSILPLLVILYLIRRFYKSFKAPRRDSEDFVNLEMLLVIPKDL